MKKGRVILAVVAVVLIVAAIIWFLPYAARKNECNKKCRNDPSDWTQESCVSSCLGEL